MNSDVGSGWSAAAPLYPEEEISVRGKASRKKLRWAYFRWLLLGSHYLYLRRPVVQFFFWASLGGLLIWWLVDLARLPALVRRHNQKALSKLLGEYHDMLDRRVSGQMAQAAAPAYPVYEAPAALQQPALPSATPRRPGYETRPAAVLLLSAALATAVVLYAFNPPVLFPVDHAAPPRP